MKYKIYNALLKTETGLLVVLLLSMIIIAVVQIVMRNFFASGLLWADSFVKIAVLWLTLIGSMVASRSGNHIAIDAMSRMFNDYWKNIISRITYVFTALVCFVVSYYSFVFVQYEYEDGGIAFANIPNWLCESIIPFAFLVIGLRYFMAVFLNFRQPE